MIHHMPWDEITTDFIGIVLLGRMKSETSVDTVINTRGVLLPTCFTKGFEMSEVREMS